ncbi:MAG: hypothetical protein LBH93_03025 [Chitinispirillales bacterium]|nr:hypothetical protein [Chitinispirillales bacterium]
MYNDDQNRSNQGQGAFVRRPIPKYSGDNNGGSGYQNQGGGGYSQGYKGGYSGGQQHGGSQPYSNSQQRGRRMEGGSGGYNSGYSGGGGGYRGGSGGGYGYNRNNNYGSNNDRLIRQNDIIIKLLKDIRDRLPAPPGMQADNSPDYGSDGSYSSNAGSYAGGDEGDYEASGGPDDSGMDPPPEQADAGGGAQDGAEEEDRYNS